MSLVTIDEVRSLADLDGKMVALGAQEPAVEKAIKQAFADARVTPNFVDDPGADALAQLVAHEVAAAPFLIARSMTTEATKAVLSSSGFRILEVPLNLPPFR